MDSGESGTLRMLAKLWEKTKPTVMERVELLERAAAALATGSLDEAQRHAAVGAAHKLAGTLGMFGYPEGTDAARAIEELLEGELASDAGARMGKLSAELRAALTKSA
jgi:HPt (histidine-containing phosphotransfer) domain-containing protein